MDLDFLEINVKEKILSMYALEIIRTPNRLRKNREQFKLYLIDYFEKKSITISEEVIPELIMSLTEGTGILYIDESDLITFGLFRLYQCDFKISQYFFKILLWFIPNESNT